MRISEMIRKLQEAKSTLGDVPVGMPDGLEVLRVSVLEGVVIVSDMDQNRETKSVWESVAAI